MRATIGPRLGPALVERHLAIVDPLLVLPFVAKPFLAGELASPVRRPRTARTLIGVGWGDGLSTEINRRGAPAIKSIAMVCFATNGTA